MAEHSRCEWAMAHTMAQCALTFFGAVGYHFSTQIAAPLQVALVSMFATFVLLAIVWVSHRRLAIVLGRINPNTSRMRKQVCYWSFAIAFCCINQFLLGAIGYWSYVHNTSDADKILVLSVVVFLQLTLLINVIRMEQRLYDRLVQAAALIEEV